MAVAKSIFWFLVTALFELGGAYLIWLWLREQRSLWYAAAGALVLFVYGILPTVQPAHFGRVQAAYSGLFLIVAVLWGWGIDKVRPDRYDLIGSAVALAGVAIIMYAPRGV